MTKRKIENICYITLGTLVLGYIIADWGSADFIGENEIHLFDIIPMKIAYYIGILICGVLIYLRAKYKIDIFESRIKNPKIKLITSLIIYPIISFTLGYLTLFDFYFSSNYFFTTEKQILSGEIYKMDITELSKGPNMFYVYFNEKMKYRLRVSQDNYSHHKKGDKINIKVNKGRFIGYYLIDKLE